MTDVYMALRSLMWVWLAVGMAVMATGVGAASPGLPVNAIQASPLAQAVSGSAPAAVPAVQAVATVQSEVPMTSAVKARWDHIAAELRCLVCQNESLASSNAELAVDLRREVRGLIEQGQSDADIRSFLVSRYGDFVLYRPPFKTLTALLWIGPFALLLLAASLLLWHLRRRTQEPAAPLSPDELQRAQQLLGEPGARRQGGRS